MIKRKYRYLHVLSQWRNTCVFFAVTSSHKLVLKTAITKRMLKEYIKI